PLPRRHAWNWRMMQLPVPAEPKTGNREPVINSLREIVGGAGALEYRRLAFLNAVECAQTEYRQLTAEMNASTWAGVWTPIVYYEFADGVSWTRTVDDRYGDGLLSDLKHDKLLQDRHARIRQRAAGRQVHDARLWQECVLH